MRDDPIIVVGSGIAGLWTALQAAPRRVLLISAYALGDGSSTAWAQGGIAAALGRDDSPRQHALETIAAGAGLVDPVVAEVITQAGPEEVRELARLGVCFDRSPEGDWALSLEAAHGRRRVARVNGDQAGQAIIQALIRAVAAAEHIECYPNAAVEGLLFNPHGACTGVTVTRSGQARVPVVGSAVVLAMGGIGGLYAVTTNPGSNRGRALAWAARAGAELRDPEFVQFHPTAIVTGRHPTWLATEALRGDGAWLINDRGERFMTKLHPDAEMAPRDIVARGVFRQLREGQQVWLDGRHAIGEAFADRFPFVHQACRSIGIDPARECIPVAPAAHYHMGGIATDLHGRSSVEGLFAVGECASTGLHGANRLASNSLLEALVMGRRAADVLKGAKGRAVPQANPQAGLASPELPATALNELRQAMASHAGVERSAKGLGELLTQLDEWEQQHGLADELIAARAVAECALRRQESRGAHYRSDYPVPQAQAHSSRYRLTDSDYGLGAGNPSVKPVGAAF